jgi:NAD(P)-dependent dehydrogenase (short-subunit alcohol dehydrogenase family)
MGKLTDKRTLITGGASGIGLATAKRFLADGAQVVIMDRDEAACRNLERTLSELRRVLVVDVSDYSAVQGAFEEIDRLFGGLDVLINNAGISIRHSFLDITLEEWRNILNVNLTGAFYVAQGAAKRMARDQGGVIINMASINAMVGSPNYADYNASKAGLIALTKTMALELAPHVRVLAVAPGYVWTPMQEAEYSSEMVEELNRKIPLERHATPEEVAGLFAFLASDEAAYMTGHVYVMDGGKIAGGLASRPTNHLGKAHD